MTHRTYMVAVKWASVPARTGAVEKALDPLGDWVRFNANTWFLSTTRSSEEIYEGVTAALMTNDLFNDLLIVIALDPRERFGRAPQWIWDWIDGQSQDPPKTAIGIIGQQQPPGGIGGVTGGIGSGIGGTGFGGGGVLGER